VCKAYTWGVQQFFLGSGEKLLLWAGSWAERVKITNKMAYLGHMTMWHVWIDSASVRYVLDTPKLSYNLTPDEEKYVIQLSVLVHQCSRI
jgi:hypothetical protein